MLITTEKLAFKSDLTIILKNMQVNNTVENVDWIFLQMADKS